ncbi:hypothetical protein BpHYR1_037313 [Brachionus plicatilis]|uniref:Uncharacterized protein n=1 Tax=Brachionus plicatilis TaxID=10195 RepID=A0A3M7RXX4_BRAPC|nr:hypothetical protein BpHYR1_037313 [Brachionus plicatilis]
MSNLTFCEQFFMFTYTSPICTLVPTKASIALTLSAYTSKSKCLACVLKSNAKIHKEMERMHGYQLLAMFF